jgi:calcium-dependent protein kinase
MWKILGAVKHLHELRICHRDLKPENFLLADSSQDSEIKLIDFGLSKRFGEDENTSLAN